MIHHKPTWLGAIGVVALLPSVTLADVSGKVFRDFNANGVFDSNEMGVANVTVKAFDPSGAQAATAVSAADGTYALTLATGTDYRVEFTWGEDWLQPAAAGGTSVQFVKNGASSINFALHNPAQTVAPGATPSVVTAVQSGSVHYGTEFVLTKTPESAGSTSPTSMNAYMTPAPTVLAQEQEIGAIWGVAHDRSRQRLLAAAFVKRFARLAGNPTTIYSVPENAGTPAPWITLDASRADPHGASPDWSKDFDVIPSVGKEGLGDVDIAEDGKTVYTIDLQTRELVLIPVNTDGSAGTPSRVALPTTLANCTDSNDIRPMGLGVRDGKVFVGSVCSGESTVSGLPIASTAARKGDPSKLRGYVHVWDGATTFAPVADFALNYQRGCLNASGGACPTYAGADWQAWTPTYPFSDFVSGSGYPQPLISDIEFTQKGDMVLGLVDRFGHMDSSYSAEPPSGSFNSGQLTIAGDTLHACKTGENTWVMEKLISGDASCSTAGKGYDVSRQATIDEFYFEDDMGAIVPGNHADVGDGGIGIVLENSAIISTVMDPARNAPWSSDGKDPWESHGLHWYDSTTGAFTKGYVLVDQGQPNDQPIWGKGNGLGDVEVLYPPAPVEIGNRVWLDTNSDGIQGADEVGIDGLEVKLVCGSDQALTTTANGGQFLFSNAQGGNAPFMEYGESCTIQVDGTQTGVKDYSLTTQNADSVSDNNPLTDLRDSDAVNNAGVAEIAVTLGNAGENNHTLDIGYKNTPVITFDPPPGPDAFSCAANVRLATSVQVNGDSQAAGSTGAGVNGLITFDYAATGELAAPFSKATAGQVGAVWGLAYDTPRKKLYASAFLKRHASFGPNGLGAIYQMDGTSATPTPSLLMDLAAKGVDVGTSPRVAASGAMDDPNELPIDASKPSWDRDAFAQVGKISLGDIDISVDGNTLWAVNLKQRELVEIDLTNTTVKATHAITDPGCSNGEFRPWAVKVHDGKVWVGTVCSAETSQLAADLKAYVQAFDGTTFTTATSFALTYSKGSIGNWPR
ncbi:SdrD B-like domain-containing protein [Thiothrix subterranea]|uniref:SdrD B-like domain-containing protein n=1 Tax=Thiothrix subterranea TaxID=2735563 RepID=UPI00280A5339|nr:SdrD B-like domain-containing protein [Thiothrix subterranea]